MTRSYRDVESARIATAQFMKEGAEAALLLLARRGSHVIDHGKPDDANDSQCSWHIACLGAAGTRFLISCTGPSLPSTLPDEVIRPADIAKERPFVGTWRLVVKAPILVLDLYWQADKPLRIMTFANGDWQNELAALAGEIC